MSDTFDKALDHVVNTVIDSCIRIVNESETVDPAGSHDQLKAVIVANLEVLKHGVASDPVRLPQ